ncbi:MAG: signal peptidase I [Reinekea sp.]
MHVFVGLLIIILAVLLCWFNRVAWFGFDIYRVESTSMLPTLHPNTIVVVNLRAYREQYPQMDDIVILKSPIAANEKLIKRVTHLPGQSLSFIKQETQMDEETRTPVVIRRKVTLENIEGYFVQGDNTQHSTDSRYFGPVDLQLICGKVVVSVL